MRVDRSKAISEYQALQRARDKKQHLQELVKKERLASERLRVQQLQKIQNDSIKGSNVDERV